MADELMLEIVTPEKMAFSGKVEEVTIPGTEGEFGVLRGHEALLSSVDIGQLNFTRNNKKIYYAVNTGYAEVTGNKVTILIETAERADQIDVTRARRAKDNAEARLEKIAKDSEEFEKARVALRRAIVRLSIAVVGASPNPFKGGNFILRNLINRFKGKIYPVNPKYQTMEGLPCYPSVNDIPGNVDMAIIFVPAKQVPQAIEDCIAKGIPGAMIESAGFAEIGADGEKLHRQLLKVKSKSPIRQIGRASCRER